MVKVCCPGPLVSGSVIVVEVLGCSDLLLFRSVVAVEVCSSCRSVVVQVCCCC